MPSIKADVHGSLKAEKARKAFEAQKLKDSQSAMDAIRDMERRTKTYRPSPLKPGYDTVTDELKQRELKDYTNRSELENVSIIQNGQFRFNDQILDIPPEKISIHTDEYEDSLLLMRESTPATTQRGRKRVRIIVEFPVDVSYGYSQLAKIITQIKKTPIATVENEKIRAELLGDANGNTKNIGVVVDNITGYVDDDFPTLIRCTLQMTWFNHFPYVDEIRYVQEVGDKILWQKSTDSNLYRQFYMEGTGDLASGRMFNDPGTTFTQDSLVIMYKEFTKVAEAVSLQSHVGGSALGRMSVSQNPATDRVVAELRKQGWHFAEENEERQPETLDGIFYRWRRLEIPFTDLDTSDALILQNMSFSLNTNPTYIQMEQYSMPTIQFLGGSVSDIRALIYGGAQHKSHEDKTPIGTSRKLSKLMNVLTSISEARVRFPKYAKENHLLISHPIAKLMKFGAYGDSAIDFNYMDENGEVHTFNVDHFLPVVVSSNSSTTIPGLPFASNLQLDFKETRLSKHKKYITYQETAGSASPKDTRRIALNLIKDIYKNTEIKLDKENFFYVPGRGNLVYVNKKEVGPEEEEAGQRLADALNVLRRFDKDVTDIDSAIASKIFQSKGREFELLTNPEAGLSISEAKNRRARGYVPTSREGIFSAAWMESFISGVFMTFSEAVMQGKPWVEPYVKMLEEYSKIETPDYTSVFKDMKLPENRKDPAFYFVNGSDKIKRYRENILSRMANNYKNYEGQLYDRLLQPDWIKNLNSPIRDELQPAKLESLSPSYNAAVTEQGVKTGVERVHDPNSSNFRIMSIQKAIADATAPTHSLSQAYPAFQVKLFTDKYNFFQKYSAADIDPSKLNDEQQVDLLDMFELSSIVDIRIIKDEYEAADAMIIRVAATKKDLVSKEGKDPFYDHENFSFSEILRKIKDGESTAGVGVSHNLETMGLKEGVRIKAHLGNGMADPGMELEFSGKIAAINGRDILEIYCLGNGHELIQNTMGYDNASSDDVYTLNSDTTDLIGEILSKSDEVRSFGNTKPEVFKNLTANLPAFMGGVSALDNIYAPNMHPKFSVGDFTSESASSFLSSAGFIGGLGAFAGPAFFGAVFSGPGALAILALGIGSLAYQGFKTISKKLSPCSFTVYQQTIWDVLQELTLRHPGFVTATVPFDNRSTIYFGEPDGIYFYRGQRSAAERSMRILAGKKSKKLLKNPTLREIYGEISSLKKDENIQQARYPIILPTAKQQINASFKDRQTVEGLTLLNMQKTFRSYHLITSEHDIIKNNIEASSVGVANSVQVYHPTEADEVNVDGKTWFSNYELTDRMKADDDIDADKINNKVFTFHNAHNEYKELELPQKYAISVLCKELGNTYKGYVEILGRSGIKPHDIAIISDNYNQINGPVGVRRVVQTLSPRSGWRTKVYPKFLVFPQSTIGSFQMKAIMKASRYWLGVDTQLFYSNMEGFKTHELANGDKQFNEFVESVSRLTGDKQTIDYGDEITKQEMSRYGEHILSGDVGFSAGSAATTIAGQLAANKVFNVKDTFDAAIKGGQSLGGEVGGLRRAVGTLNHTKNIKNGREVVGKAGKIMMHGGKLTLKTGSRLVGGVGGFIAASLLENAIEGFISYMKYRQPITIFPLSKDGQPWMAGLNGYKENTVLEHIGQEMTEAGDKLGMAMKLVKFYLEEWTGDSPVDVGVGGTYDVASDPYDGDTFEIKNGSINEKIRVLGYDTGELKGGKNKAEPGPIEKEMAQRGKERLTQLIKENGNSVSIKRQGKDAYGRTLAKVYIGDKNVSEIMTEEGYAYERPHNYRPDYSSELPQHLKTNKEAIAEQREKFWKNIKDKNDKFRRSNGGR